MTRKIIALSIVLVAVFSVITLNGCKKEEPAKTDAKSLLDGAADVADDAVEDHAGHDHE